MGRGSLAAPFTAYTMVIYYLPIAGAGSLLVFGGGCVGAEWYFVSFL